MKEFVTFEIGKKLEEKGFIHGYNLYGYKPVYSDVNTIKFIWDIGAYEKDYFGENIPCPMISQVMKWLRDEKKIYLSVTYVPKIDGIPDMFYPKFQKIGNFEFTKFCGCGNYNTYEEAALAGIEYVLDNIL